MCDHLSYIPLISHSRTHPLLSPLPASLVPHPHIIHTSSAAAAAVVLPAVSYISARDLAARIHDATLQTQTLVIDVRDLDRDFGYIPNSRNVPECTFDEHVEKLAAEVAALAAEHHVVFHCMFSQVRGPKCAMKLHENLTANHPNAQCKMYVHSACV